MKRSFAGTLPFALKAKEREEQCALLTSETGEEKGEKQKKKGKLQKG